MSCSKRVSRENNRVEYINIVLSADDNYAQHVAVVMASIATNTTFKNIRVFLLSDGISTDKKQKLNITAANHKIILEVIEMQNKKEFTAFYTLLISVLRRLDNCPRASALPLIACNKRSLPASLFN